MPFTQQYALVSDVIEFPCADTDGHLQKPTLNKGAYPAFAAPSGAGSTIVPWYQMLLVYLAETWKVTAGKSIGLEELIVDLSPGQTGINAPGPRIVSVNYAVTTQPPMQTTWGRGNEIVDIGCAFWQVDGGNTEVIRLGPKNGVLYPTDPDTTGITFLLREGVFATATVNTEGPLGQPVTINNGEILTASSGDLEALGDFVGHNDTNQIVESSIMHTPEYSPDSVFRHEFPYGNELWKAPLREYSTGPLHALLMAYASEIWQAQAVTTRGGVIVNLVAENADLTHNSGRFVKRVRVTASQIQPNPTVGMGPGRMPYIGQFAFIYRGGWMGPMKFMNAFNLMMLPDSQDCTGFWICVKEGIHAEIISYETPTMMLGMTTPNGDLNLAAGLLFGLDY